MNDPNTQEWLASVAKAKAARKKETAILILFVLGVLAIIFGLNIAWEAIRAMIWKRFL